MLSAESIVARAAFVELSSSNIMKYSLPPPTGAEPQVPSGAEGAAGGGVPLAALLAPPQELAAHCTEEPTYCTRS